MVQSIRRPSAARSWDGLTMDSFGLFFDAPITRASLKSRLRKKVAGIVFRTPEVERIKQLISVDFGFTLIGASNALELDKAVGYVLRKITNRAIGGQHANALCTGRSVPN
jgi:hypothetical protein